MVSGFDMSRLTAMGDWVQSISPDDLQQDLAILRGERSSAKLDDMDAVDAKIAAAEARTDTKFAKLEGKLDLIVAQLDTIKGNATDARTEARATRRTVIGTGISLGALILAIAAFGVNVFSLGSRVDDIARAEAIQVLQQSQVQPSVPRRIVASPTPTPRPSQSARP